MGVGCKCYARFTPRYVSVCVSEFVCVRENEYLCVYVGGGARIAVLESQVFNLQAFLHEFQFVSVFICMHVWCVCVYVYKVKAHLLMALIRSLRASVSYYIHNIHCLGRKLPGHDHNMIRRLNNCRFHVHIKLLGDSCAQILL